MKTSEGCRLVAYLCPAGIWTIGYGHAGKDVYAGLKITQERAEALLVADLAAASTIVRKYVRAPLTAPQEAALVSFVFNVGMARFSGSTLVRRLNQGDYACVPTQIARWNKGTVKGQLVVLPGLVARRAAEAALWKIPA
ncbi:lysozyme [Xanthomonas hyacinthi]|uniref:lysozyme n=1 Tax=Xanthomonas hyacinthi TaxID=56455 RepID=UPI001FCC3D8B|nr:lysozyme [Xanthomonas hyacinthi]